MINLRKLFNTNYNIILISLTTLIFTILIKERKNLKFLGKTLITISIIFIILSFTIPIILNLFTNELIKIFIKPIITNIKTNILISSVIILVIGIILLLTEKKNKNQNTKSYS